MREPGIRTPCGRVLAPNANTGVVDSGPIAARCPEMTAFCFQLPDEKCPEKARANEPKPPRVTLPDRESEDAPGDERLDDESLLKKLLRDDHDPPWPDPDPDPGAQAVPFGGSAGAAAPAGAGVQFWRGIRA